MSIFRGRVEVRRDINLVWAYLIDPTNGSEWIYGAPKVENLSSGIMKLGSQFKLIYKDYFMVVQVKEFVDCGKLLLEFIEGPATGSQREYLLSQNGDQTILESDLVVRLKGLWKTLLPVLLIREYKDRKYSIGKIKEILEEL